MASGVAINDEVIAHYELIRVRLQGKDERERFKLVVMRLSDNLKEIIVDKTNCLQVKDVENENDVFKKIISMLPPKECRYALYDCKYTNKESVKEDLVFIFFAPDDAPMKSKMLYASSKNALKSKLQGMKFEWQINDNADKDSSGLVEKLGGSKIVTSLEGKPL